MNILKKLIAIASVAIISLPVVAGTFSGIIRNQDGTPMEGVMIRVSDDVSGISESVYSSPEGKFQLTTRLKGNLDIRLRTPYFRDLETTIELGAHSTVNRELVMRPMESDYEISASLPAAYHFGSLAFETGDDAVFNQYQFQRDCLSCHQLGNSMTRIPRDPESWHLTIIRMHRYMGGTFDQELRERRSVILSEGFNGKPISARPVFPLDKSLMNAKVTEYRLDKGNPHDAIVHQGNGISIRWIRQFPILASPIQKQEKPNISHNRAKVINFMCLVPQPVRLQILPKAHVMHPTPWTWGPMASTTLPILRPIPLAYLILKLNSGSLPT